MIRSLKLKSKKAKEKQIYNAYADKMIFICYRYVNNMMDAEEILHNGFLKVFRNLHKFIELHEKGFEYWIKKIMVNESLMHLRKNNNFQLVSIDNIAELENNMEPFEENQTAEAYLKLIDELPIGYRTVLIYTQLKVTHIKK